MRHRPGIHARVEGDVAGGEADDAAKVVLSARHGAQVRAARQRHLIYRVAGGDGHDAARIEARDGHCTGVFAGIETQAGLAAGGYAGAILRGGDAPRVAATAYAGACHPHHRVAEHPGHVVGPGQVQVRRVEAVFEHSLVGELAGDAGHVGGARHRSPVYAPAERAGGDGGQSGHVVPAFHGHFADDAVCHSAAVARQRGHIARTLDRAFQHQAPYRAPLADDAEERGGVGLGADGQGQRVPGAVERAAEARNHGVH